MFYVDENGRFLGVFAGVNVTTMELDEKGNEVTTFQPNIAIPAGAIEVPTMPTDGRQMWTGEAWAPLPRRTVVLERLAQLDGIMPRLLEDLVTATGTTLYGENLAAYTEKQALRAELAGL